MTRRFPLLLTLIAMLAGMVVIAGCGGNDEESSSGGGGSTTEQTDGGGTDLSDNPQVKAAVEQCKSTVDAAPQLSDSAKNDIKDLCDKAASGNADDIRQATKDVCTKVIEETVPDGAAREQALKACDQATTAP